MGEPTSVSESLSPLISPLDRSNSELNNINISQYITYVDPKTPPLAIKPNELVFDTTSWDKSSQSSGSGSEPRTYVYLMNQSAHPVIFKTRATHPRRYLAGPSSGIIPPDGEQVIKVILNPKEDELPDDPAKRAKRKDRFVILSYPIFVNPQPDVKLIPKIWEQVLQKHKPKEGKHACYESMFKCCTISEKEREKEDSKDSHAQEIKTVRNSEAALRYSSLEFTSDRENSDIDARNNFAQTTFSLDFSAIKPRTFSGEEVSVKNDVNAEKKDSTSAPSVNAEKKDSTSVPSENAEKKDSTSASLVNAEKKDSTSASLVNAEKKDSTIVSSPKKEVSVGILDMSSSSTPIQDIKAPNSVVNNGVTMSKERYDELILKVDNYESIVSYAAKLSADMDKFAIENKSLRKALKDQKSEADLLKKSLATLQEQLKEKQRKKEEAESRQRLKASDRRASDSKIQPPMNASISIWQVVALALICFIVGKLF